MKVIVATQEGQGARESDFCWTEEGELVYFPIIECDRERVDGPCGCRRSLAGVRSLKATTTFKVVEQDLDAEGWAAALMDAYVRGGWCEPGDEVWRGYAREEARFLADTAARCEVGWVLERRGEDISRRFACDRK